MTTIRTERLLLRPAQDSDLAAIHAILSDPQATAYWSTLPHDSLDQSRDWLAGMFDIPADQGEDFIVEHQGRVIGKAGLYRFPEIGFIFAPDVWGQGFAREALEALIARAFGPLGQDHIIADVDPRNAACLGLLSRLGFHKTGQAEKTWLIGDQWCDSVYLRLDAPVGAGSCRPEGTDA